MLPHPSIYEIPETETDSFLANQKLTKGLSWHMIEYYAFRNLEREKSSEETIAYFSLLTLRLLMYAETPGEYHQAAIKAVAAEDHLSLEEQKEGSKKDATTKECALGEWEKNAIREWGSTPGGEARKLALEQTGWSTSHLMRRSVGEYKMYGINRMREKLWFMGLLQILIIFAEREKERNPLVCLTCSTP